jgi:hypothetical protein
VPRWRTDLVRRTATGRLLRRSPDGEDTELLGGLEFANGVALAADGSFVAVAETGTGRLHRVWLTGDRAGRSALFVDGLDGYPDNIALGPDGLIWVALPSPRSTLLTRVHRLPGAARAVVGALPERMSPRPSSVVSAVAVDDAGRVVHELRGTIDGFRLLTGVREPGDGCGPAASRGRPWPPRQCLSRPATSRRSPATTSPAGRRPLRTRPPRGRRR